MAEEVTISLEELTGKTTNPPPETEDKSFEIAAPEIEDRNSPVNMSLDQIERLEAVNIDPIEFPELTDDTNEQLQLFVGFSDKRIAELKAKGEIGFAENFNRKKNTALGDLNLLRRIGSFNIEGRTRAMMEVTMALMGAEATEEGVPDALKSPSLKLLSVYNSVERFREDDYTDEKLKDLDNNNILDFLSELEEERIRGTTIGGEIAKGALALPEFLLSFIATGGLAALSKSAIKRGMSGFVKGKVTETGKRTITEALGRRLRRAVRGTTEIAVTGAVRTAAAPQLVAKQALERQVSSQFELTGKGMRLARESHEAPVTSILKSYGDIYIEMMSEGSGQAIGKGLRGAAAVAEKLPGVKIVPQALEKLFKKYNPLTKVTDLWSPGVYDGFLAEMGEEQLGDLMRASVGLQDFGAGDPNSVVDRMISSIHGGRELAINAGVIAPLTILAGIRKPGVGGRIPEAEQPENKKVTDEQVDKIVADKQAQDVKENAAKKASLGLEKAKPVEKEPSAKPKPVEGVKPVEAPKPVVKKEVEKPKAEISKERKLIIEGRVTELTRESTKVLDDIDTAEARRRELVAADRSTKQIDEKIDRLGERFDKIDEEIAQIRTAPGEVTAIRPRDKIVTTPSQVLAAVKARAQQAVKFTRAEVKQTQGEVITALNRSDLSAEDKAGFIKTVRNIQTPKQFEQQLPKIQARIKKLETKASKRRLRAKIAKSLKAAKPTGRGRKLKSKFTPEVQKTLDKIAEATKVDAEVANNRIQKNLEELANPDITPERRVEVLLDNGILDLASNIGERSVSELEGLNERIRNLIAQGRDAAKAKLDREKARRETIRAESLETLPSVDQTASQKKGLFKRFREGLRTARHFSISAWEDLTDALSVASKTKEFESPLSQHSRVIEIEQKEKKDTFDDSQKVIQLAMEAFNLKTDRQVNRQIDRDSKPIDFGIFTDTSGQNVRLELTKSEIRKIWMEMQDPLLKENVEVAEGGYLLGNIKIRGFTQEMQDAIFGEMTVEDTKFAQAQLGFYQDLYLKLNKQYRKDNGIDLPFNEFYSPIRRKLAQDRVQDTFLNEQGYRRSIDPSAVKSRVKNFELIRVQSDMEAMLGHISEISHYTNWSDKLKDLNAIYGNLDVRNAIERTFGSGTMRLIDSQIEQFANRGLRRATELEGVFNKARINFTVAALALKPALFLKQQASIFAYAEGIPTTSYVAGVLDFWKNPIQNWRILQENSALFKTRSANMERDIKDAADSTELSAFKKTQSLRNMMLMFTKWGDKTAIAVGGWSVYRHTLNETGSQKKAIKAFERATATTQQSSDLSQLSPWQKGGAFAKLFTMFTSSQRQYLARELSALTNVLADPKAFVKGKGRISRTNFAKRIAIYHFILPMFFQWISDFGQWDEDEQKRAATLGSLNGLFILGDLLDWLTRKAINELSEDPDISTFDWNRSIKSPVFDIGNGVYDAFKEIDFGDISAEETLEATEELFKESIGPAFGIPAKRIYDTFDGIDDIINEDEPATGILKLMGWSPYTVDKKIEKPGLLPALGVIEE